MDIASTALHGTANHYITLVSLLLVAFLCYWNGTHKTGQASIRSALETQFLFSSISTQNNHKRTIILQLSSNHSAG